MNTEGETVNAALESLMNKVIKQYFSQNNALSSSSSSSNQPMATTDPNSNSNVADLLNMMQTLLYKQARAQQTSTSSNQSDSGSNDKVTSMTTFLNQAEQLGLLDNASSQKLKLLMTSFQVLEDGASSVDGVPLPSANETVFPVRYNRGRKQPQTLAEANAGSSAVSPTALQTAMLARLSQNRINQENVAVKHSVPRTKSNAAAHGFSPMVVFSEAAVKSLISIYGKYRQDFIGHAKDRMRAWEKVCDEMRVRGFLFTRQQCKNKWHTLVYNYRQCNEYNRQVSSVGLGGVQGYKRKECPYYKEIADIMNSEEEDMHFGQRVAPIFRPREAPRYSEIYTNPCSTPESVESGDPALSQIESSVEENPTISVKIEPASPVSSEQQTVFDYVVTSNEPDDEDSRAGQDSCVIKSDNHNGDVKAELAGLGTASPIPESSTSKRKFSYDVRSDFKQRKPRLDNDSSVGAMCDSSNPDTAHDSSINHDITKGQVATDLSGGIMEYIHFCERRNQQQLREIKELFRAQEESRMVCHRENMEMMSQFLMVLRDISKK